eukprot:scaffold59860_cov20-Tisochrysis_lutea.AAC.2
MDHALLVRWCWTMLCYHVLAAVPCMHLETTWPAFTCAHPSALWLGLPKLQGLERASRHRFDPQRSHASPLFHSPLCSPHILVPCSQQ